MICDIYVETSLSFNQKGDGIVGIALVVEDCDARTVYGFVKDCTQSKAIIIGITKALSFCVYQDIRLHLSCTFVGNALKNGWLPSWEAALYKSAKGRMVKNAREWHELFEKLQGRNVEVHLNEFNGYRNYLIFESKQRMKKHDKSWMNSFASGKK